MVFVLDFGRMLHTESLARHTQAPYLSTTYSLFNFIINNLIILVQTTTFVFFYKTTSIFKLDRDQQRAIWKWRDINKYIFG